MGLPRLLQNRCLRSCCARLPHPRAQVSGTRIKRENEQQENKCLFQPQPSAQKAQECQRCIKLKIKHFSHSSLLDIPSVPHKSHVSKGCMLWLLFPTSCQVLQNKIWLLFPSPSAQPFSPSSCSAPRPPQQQTQLQTHKQVELLLRTSGTL